MKYRRKPQIIEVVKYEPGMEDGKTFRCEMDDSYDLNAFICDICGMGRYYDLFPYVDTLRGRRYIGINTLIATDKSAVYTPTQLAAEYEPVEEGEHE